MHGHLLHPIAPTWSERWLAWWFVSGPGTAAGLARRLVAGRISESALGQIGLFPASVPLFAQVFGRLPSLLLHTTPADPRALAVFLCRQRQSLDEQRQACIQSLAAQSPALLFRWLENDIAEDIGISRMAEVIVALRASGYLQDERLARAVWRLRHQSRLSLRHTYRSRSGELYEGVHSLLCLVFCQNALPLLVDLLERTPTQAPTSRLRLLSWLDARLAVSDRRLSSWGRLVATPDTVLNDGRARLRAVMIRQRLLATPLPERGPPVPRAL